MTVTIVCDTINNKPVTIKVPNEKPEGIDNCKYFAGYVICSLKKCLNLYLFNATKEGIIKDYKFCKTDSPRRNFSIAAVYYDNEEKPTETIYQFDDGSFVRIKER